MRFILFVEGDTEQKAVPSFLKRWLDPKLERPVGIKPIKFQGWAEMQKGMLKKAKMYLEGPMHSDVFGVIGLMDLYGPSFYPDGLTTASERLSWARNKLEESVASDRFRMFFAVHEIEAWLLSQPQLFPEPVKKVVEKSCKNPEDVNFDAPPSKLLGQLYQNKTGRTYKKVTYGGQLFAKLDPELAANKCPELKRMLECMLQMANDGKC